jgi:hypothetical protein
MLNALEPAFVFRILILRSPFIGLLSPITAFVPTYRSFAIAAPPAVVIVPPFVLDEAFVAFSMLIPPANLTLAFVEEVDAIFLLNLVFPSQPKVIVAPPAPLV